MAKGGEDDYSYSLMDNHIKHSSCRNFAHSTLSKQQCQNVGCLEGLLHILVFISNPTHYYSLLKMCKQTPDLADIIIGNMCSVLVSRITKLTWTYLVQQVGRGGKLEPGLQIYYRHQKMIVVP